MSDVIFTNQTLITIGVKAYTDLSTATVKKILFKRPDQTTGEWIATRLTGTDQLEYDLQAGDMPLQRGTWQRQAYVVIGGKVGLGGLSEFIVQNPLQ